MFKQVSLTLLTLVSLAAVTSMAATIDPELQQVLNSKTEGEMVRVMMLIDDRLDEVVGALIEFDGVPEIDAFPVDSRVSITVRAYLIQQVFVVLAVNPGHRRADLDRRALRELVEVLHHLVGAPLGTGLPALWAMWNTYRGVEHAKVVRNVRHGADGRS